VEGLRADKSPLVRAAAAAAVEAIAKQAGGGQKSEELGAPEDAQQRKSGVEHPDTTNGKPPATDGERGQDARLLDQGSNTVLVITSTVATVAFAAAVAVWMRRKW